MLPDVGSDKRLAFSHFPKRFNGELRHDFFAHLVLQTRPRPPSFNFFPPFRQIGLAGFSLQQPIHFFEHVGNVANDGHIDRHALGNRRRIDVDMNDLVRHRKEMFGVADHPVIETRADGQHHVAMLHRQIRFQRAVHAQHAQKLRIGSRKPAQAHQRIGHRRTQTARQRGQGFGGIAQNHPATRIDDRAFGV